MSRRIYWARNKVTGREWPYRVRRTFGRAEYAFEGDPPLWRPSLATAKAAAVDVGTFKDWEPRKYAS